MKKIRSLIDEKKRAEVKKALAEGRLDKLLEKKKVQPEPVQPKQPKKQLSPEEQKELDAELVKSLKVIFDTEKVKHLIECGANPNARDNNNETALMIAIGKYIENMDGTRITRIVHGQVVGPSFDEVTRERHEEGIKNVEILLEAGADVNAKDNMGKTALDRIRYSKFFERLFEKYGAKE